MTSEVAETLKRSFRERCLALASRGLGQVAIAPDITVEAAVVPEDGLVAFTTIQYGVDEWGKQRAVWTDLLLDANDTLSKHLETTHNHPRPGDGHHDEQAGPLCGEEVEAAIRTMDDLLSTHGPAS